MIKNLDFDGFLCGCGTYLVYKQEVLMESHIPYERGVRYIEAMEQMCIRDSAYLTMVKQVLIFPEDLSVLASRL